MVVLPPGSISVDKSPDHVVELIHDLHRWLEAPVRKKDIHAIRICIKRLRAWLRLSKGVPVQNENDWQELDDLLRTVSRNFSAQRDRQACIETLRWLRSKEKSRCAGETIEKIIRDLASGKSTHIEEVCIEDREQLSGLLHDRYMVVQPKLDVESCLQKTYRKARKIGKLSYSNIGTIDDLHRQRKWCKFLFYQLELFPLFKELISRKDLCRLEKIGKKLGRFHDLVLIRAYVACQSGYISYRESERLMRVISIQYKRLHTDSCRLYHQVFH